jgi:hypothetical protein
MTIEIEASVTSNAQYHQSDILAIPLQSNPVSTAIEIVSHHENLGLNKNI